MEKSRIIFSVTRFEKEPVIMAFFQDEENSCCIELNKKIFLLLKKILKKIIKQEQNNLPDPKYTELPEKALNEIVEGWEEQKKQDKEGDKALNDLMSFFYKGMLVEKYGLDVLSPEEKEEWAKEGIK